MLKICIIDDDIPTSKSIQVDDTTLIGHSLLKTLSAVKDDWGDSDLYMLVHELLNENDGCHVHAFTNPEIYLSELQLSNFRPDIVIFDWEYKEGGRESGELLKEILDASFVLVYVYTGGTHEQQVQSRLSLQDLASYRDRRLYVLMKDEPGSSQTLIETSRELAVNNFSFKFSRQLRKASVDSIEKVLVNLGSHHIDFVKAFLGEGEGIETDLKVMIAEKISSTILEDEDFIESLCETAGIDRTKINSLLDVISSKFTDEIKSLDFDGLGTTPGTTDPDVLKELWSYRLYYQPSDKLVRKGDVICNTASSEYFLVISADCDLVRFWHKNFGFINLLPLFDFKRDLDRIKSLFGLTRKEDVVDEIIRSNICPGSITGSINGLVEGPFILPFFKHDNQSMNLIGFPKSMQSLEIPPRELNQDETPKCRQKHRLNYDYWNQYKRVLAISEPFLSPVVQHCLSSIFGYGTPNYPKAIKNIVKDEAAAVLETET